MNSLPDFNSALIESRSLRNSAIAEYDHPSALELLNRAKVLVMASWQGNQYCTTNQIAEWYQVSEDTVRQNIVRNREEYGSDGLKVLKGKDLKIAREVLSLPPDTSQATVWTPRAALRLGMFLRDSLQAVAVRNLLLDIATKKPEPPVETKRLLPSSMDAINLTKTAVINAGVDPSLAESMALSLLAEYDPENAKIYEVGKRLISSRSVVEEAFVSPSEIGELVAQKLDLPKAVSAIEINKTFNSLGFQVQTSETDSKGKAKKVWHLTDAGKQYAKVFTDTAKGHGKTVCVIRWSPKVVDLVVESLNR